ncbi:MAG: hypothetical protein CMF62_02430 [Magnetococcales bacterium]|nr:hypothetical protein [Magnetococcales bacterium]|tara:strand:- start:22276 stop:24474 length:2199 start_codon:yes stop_codon:yes gene_type:complete
MSNPFYSYDYTPVLVPNKMEIIVNTDTHIKNPFFASMEDKIKSSDFKRVLAICMRDDTIKDDEMYEMMMNRTLPKSLIGELSENYTLIDVSRNMVNIENHKNSLVEISDNFLNNFNHNKLLLNKKEYVLCMFELNESLLKLYNYIFEGGHSIKNILDSLSVIKYYGSDKVPMISERFSKLIRSSKETDQWDFGTASKVSLTKEYINSLMKSSTTNKEKYDLFTSLAISKDLCHLLLCPNILSLVEPVILDSKDIIRYAMGYQWLSLYLKEKKHEFDDIFIDITTASKLPYFPYTPYNLKSNPYLCIMENDKEINSMNNLLGLYQIKNYADYGINTFSIFKRKLNFFLSGNYDYDIFNGLNWDSIYLSGNFIPACVPKCSPLHYLMNIDNSNEEYKDGMYYSEYYRNKFVYLFIDKENVFDFFDKIKEVYDIIQKNVKDLTYTISKSITIDVLNDKELTEKEKYTLYTLYVPLKMQKNGKNERLKHDNIFYNEYYNLVKEDNITFRICKELDLENSDLVISIDGNPTAIVKEKYKFILKNKNIEIISEFESKQGNIKNIIEDIAYPVYRGYYNGENLHLLPSCVSALMTGINIDSIKNISKNKEEDYFNELLTLRSAGYGTLLSQDTKVKLCNFILNNEKWKTIYNASPETINEIFGAKIIDDKIFKTKSVIEGIPEEFLYKELEYGYYETPDELREYYMKDEINFDTLQTINKEGKINPIKKWVFDAGRERN